MLADCLPLKFSITDQNFEIATYCELQLGCFIKIFKKPIYRRLEIEV